MSDSIDLRERLRLTEKILEESECDKDQNKILCLPHYKYMLELSIKIYKKENLTIDGKLECQWSKLNWCRDNIIRVLKCIRKINKHGQDEDKVITYDEDLVAIIKNAIKTCCYFKHDTPDIPEGFKELVLLKEANNALFQECVDEILKTVVMPGRYTPTYNFVLHPGFQKRILGIRPGPSPKVDDEKGLFLCKLRFFIRSFLVHYKIKFTQNERFAKFHDDCIKAIEESGYKPSESLPALPEQEGGRSSRRRKVYKTTRRNNKNKNKKHYKRKRHTKRCKKSHRRSRR